jgi:hypothetical protein
MKISKILLVGFITTVTSFTDSMAQNPIVTDLY